MAGEIEAKLKAERMFAEARAKALGGPYANISKEYVNKYMDSSSLSKALADRVSSDYSLGYLSGWAGIPGDMLNALTSWAVSGIPDQRLRQQAKQSLTVAGTEDIGEAMGADVESSAFQWGTVGLPGLEDLAKKSPYLSMVLLHATKDPRNIVPRGSITNKITDIFDTKYIRDASKGEGHAARGWGLYFAESPSTFKSYEKKFSGRSPGDDIISHVLKINDGDSVKAYKELTRRADLSAGTEEAQRLRAMAEKVRHGYDPRATMLDVDVPDETIGKMMDLDAPFSEQPENVKAVFEKHRDTLEEMLDDYDQVPDLEEYNGDELYQILERAGENDYLPVLDVEYERALASDERASLFLNESGVPGLRFFDGVSRKAGEGTRNVVLFDPNNIREVNRNGELIYYEGF